MVTFVTTNEGKVREAREYLDAPVDRRAFDYPEVQADDLAAVAAHGARAAYRELGEPVIVDDSGLTVDALGGFPGPYSAYVEDTVGIERVWRLVEPEDDHGGAFRAVLAYCDGEAFAAAPDRSDATTDEGVREGEDVPPVELFEGVVPGEIVPPRGEGGFGYDPIFEYRGTTFAEMDTERKNAVSHRGRALGKFAEWFADADR